MDVAQKGYVPSRIAIARLDRPATRPRTASTTVGAWAPAAAACRGTLAGDRTALARGDGGRDRHRGLSTGTLASGSVRVTFSRFTDDGRTFVDGTVSVANPDATSQPWVIRIDVRASGAHTGAMHADLRVNNATKPLPTKSGTWTAVYDGRSAPPLPALGPCYAQLPQPSRLAVAARRAGRRALVTVTADVAGDRRPVHRARVRVAGRTVKTGADGRAVLRLPARGRAVAVTATAGDTFLPGRVTLRR